MAKRKIITIDPGKCTGCGACVPNCPEGAIQMIDGKARLVSDLFCDGLGACLGSCPEGAITIEEREAAPYDEAKVMENIIPHGENTIAAHLAHLRDHGEQVYLQQAIAVLQAKGRPVPAGFSAVSPAQPHTGCPGSRAMDFSARTTFEGEQGAQPSALRHWPIQLHLVSPQAGYFQKKDVLLAADCVAYALGGFHGEYLRGKSLAIACPKLDGDQEVYVDKIRALIDEALINTLTVMIMEVPCCRGLIRLAEEARSRAQRTVPLKVVIVGIQGAILKEQWVS